MKLGTLVGIYVVGAAISAALAWKYADDYSVTPLTGAGWLRATLGWPYYGPLIAYDIARGINDAQTLTALAVPDQAA